MPVDLKVSDLVRKCGWMGYWDFFDSTSDEKKIENYCLVLTTIIRYELKHANTEIQYLEKLNNEQEKSTRDKELIIYLLHKGSAYKHYEYNSKDKRCCGYEISSSRIPKNIIKNKEESLRIPYSEVAKTIMPLETQQLCNKYINLTWTQKIDEPVWDQ